MNKITSIQNIMKNSKKNSIQYIFENYEKQIYLKNKIDPFFPKDVKKNIIMIQYNNKNLILFISNLFWIKKIEYLKRDILYKLRATSYFKEINSIICRIQKII